MEIIQLGKTDIPLEVILEYMESLKQIYTAESYDLFAHNCNNYSNDLAMFLLGKGIPQHITSLPETVLNTPFGMMLKPQLDRQMRAITQAAVPAQAIPPQPTAASASGLANGVKANNSMGNQQAKSANAKLAPHPHDQLKLPTFKKASTQPVSYNKVPPLEKLVAKMGTPGNDPAVRSAVEFITIRNREGAQEATLPDMPALAKFFLKSTKTLPVEVLFTSYDLFRLIVADARASGYFAQEHNSQTFLAMLEHINALEKDDCPYNLTLVAIQMSCNMFNSPVFEHLLQTNEKISSAIITLITDNLLDTEHANLRVAAASLAYNLTTVLYRLHTSSLDPATTGPSPRTSVPESQQVELAASLIEALSAENNTSAEAVKGEVLSLARLVYRAPKDGEICDLCRAMDAGNVVLGSGKRAAEEDRGLVSEIGRELLGKGLE